MEQIKKMNGKIAVITGATSGIGLAAATELARMGAFVIGVGRSDEKCARAKESILSSCPDGQVVYHIADLSIMKQVRELAKSISQTVETRGGRVDVLINNAGTVSSWFTATAEGFETQFAVNYLAAFVLTHELMPLLKLSQGARIITTSSGSHYRTRIHWKDIQLRKHYNCLLAYKQCKLADVLFTAELNRRLGQNSSIRAFAVDPGLVNTDIGLKGTSGIERFVWSKRSKGGVEPVKGAATIIYLASEENIKHENHIYWKDCMPKKPSRYSRRQEVAQRLWAVTERMCGIDSGKFGIGSQI